MIIASRQLRAVAPRCLGISTNLPRVRPASFTRQAPAYVQRRGKKTTTSFTLSESGILSRENQSVTPEPSDEDGNEAEGETEAGVETEADAQPKKPRKRRAKAAGDLSEGSSLPQGLIPLDPLPLEEENFGYPTVLEQVRRNMRKFENCVLLTRVGGFYELYFEHAEEYGQLLNLKVAFKHPSAKATWEPVAMAGFPFFQLDRYLKILVQDLNRYVAIAEEFPNDPSEKIKSGGLMHDRRVSRVVTPGTLIDENFMDPFSNNYVLAVQTNDTNPGDSGVPPSDPSTAIGLAWLDLSTGHFFTQATTLAALSSFLSRIGPKEVVLDERFQGKKDDDLLFNILEEERYLVSYVNSIEFKPISEWTAVLEAPIPPGVIGQFTPEEIRAGSALLHYVETRLQGSDVKLQPPTRQSDVMGIDKNTMRALEIRTTMREDSVSGSLLQIIRRTVTKGGARLLGSWLTSPSTSLEIINSRLNIVTHMLQNDTLLERVKVLLKRSHDSHRLLQKFTFGRGDADDLIALASTVFATQDLVMTLIQDSTERDGIRAMVDRIQLDGPSILAARIKEAIDEEGIEHQHQIDDNEADEIKLLTQSIVTAEGGKDDIAPRTQKKKKPTGIRDYYSEDSEAWIMKPSASQTLKRLHQELTSLQSDKEDLTRDLGQRLGVSSLTLRFTPGLGHICHVRGKDFKRDLALSGEVKSVSSSKSTRSFHHPEWTSLGRRLDTAKLHIRSEEQHIFNKLRSEVILNIIKLRRNAAVLDELDVACSFATLAAEKNWARPILNKSSKHMIVGGRHPTVEGGLMNEGRTFVTNDCFVGDKQRIWLISGPNMAGKSTFLRQNALITILAQVGSYVPAEYAELGIVDQIFSRVGSADNLYRDQSTFMVEMLETALILKNATARSFVIMDEIGRGTTPLDGTAVAFACLHHLYHVNRARTLFATHFHDLADRIVDAKMDGIGFYCTDVDEDGVGGFRYVHKLRQGVNRDSHALKVARLAGMPEEAIAVARKFLESENDSV